jgi:hypothetical protein
MDSKPAHDLTPSTPPDDDVLPGARTPTARTLPHTPPFSPSQQQRQRQPQKITDPVLKHLKRAVDQCSRGKISGSDQKLRFELSSAQLQGFERGLQDEKPSLWSFWEHKLRYDYEGSNSVGSLVLRMPSSVHEDFIRSLESTIEKELATLADKLSISDEKTASEVRQIRKSGSTTLKYTELELEGGDREAVTKPAIVRHSPDSSFKHPIAGSQAPGLVVEVSYSQQSKKLARLADSYIINSRHKIRCVVAIDIKYVSPEQKGYHDDRTATVSVWRASSEKDDGKLVCTCKQDENAVPFRDRDGQPCEGALQLTLADFLHPTIRKAVLPTSTQDGNISIPFEILTELLNKAESDQEFPQDSEDDIPKVFLKRKRTPSGELSDSREGHYTQLENADMEKDQNNDSEWKSGSRGKRQALSEHANTIVLRRSTRTRHAPDEEVV